MVAECDRALSLPNEVLTNLFLWEGFLFLWLYFLYDYQLEDFLPFFFLNCRNNRKYIVNLYFQKEYF